MAPETTEARTAKAQASKNMNRAMFNEGQGWEKKKQRENKLPFNLMRRNEEISSNLVI